MSLNASHGVNSSKKLGIIAGIGSLPHAVATEAKNAGYEVIGVAFQLGDDFSEAPASNSLESVADEFHKISIGKFGSLISLLKKLSVREAVLAGKVPKNLLYKNKKKIIPDLKTLKMLFSLKNRSDDTIMTLVVKELEKNGITIHKTTKFTKNLLAPEGVLTTYKPTKSDLEDLEFGWEIARNMGHLDIGQTVVVKNKAVMAVEAIEGTDEAIKRGGLLANKGAVIIKISKPHQDMRFDVPAVGLETLHSMKKADAKMLAIEAGKCIIVDKEKFINEANKAGIAIVGIKK
jgi:DUF1009 family protein